MTPEFHREIGIPRVAAIEYPYGRPVGQVNDVEGQRMVLREALSFMEKADHPGEVCHLPGRTETHQVASTGNLTDCTIISG